MSDTLSEMSGLVTSALFAASRSQAHEGGSSVRVSSASSKQLQQMMGMLKGQALTVRVW